MDFKIDIIYSIYYSYKNSKKYYLIKSIIRVYLLVRTIKLADVDMVTPGGLLPIK